MTNIQLKHGHKNEIDLLAANLEEKKYYHVEISVKTTHKLKFRGKHGYSIESFLQKFEEYRIKNEVEGFFNHKPYQKVLVVWDTRGDIMELNKTCEPLGIKVWGLVSIIYDLANHKTTCGSRDDILRAMELVFLERDWEKKNLKSA